MTRTFFILQPYEQCASDYERTAGGRIDVDVVRVEPAEIALMTQAHILHRPVKPRSAQNDLSASFSGIGRKAQL